MNKSDNLEDVLVLLLNNVQKPDTQISRELGVDRDTIRRWKQKLSRPQPGKYEKIAEYFGVTVKQLVGEEPITGLEYIFEYPAGPCPPGFDPELWSQVPSEISEEMESVIKAFYGPRGGIQMSGADDLNSSTTRHIWAIMYYGMLEIASKENE